MSNIYTIKEHSSSNGEGLRTSIFLSGCNLHCKGCFNYEAWDFNSGKKITDEVIDEILETINKPYISGLSILGGEPMDIRNQETVSKIIQSFRQKFGKEKTIWLYTGYTLNTVPTTQFTKLILKGIDVIVDGPFKLELYDPRLKFRGSSNQRILRKRFGKFYESKR